MQLSIVIPAFNEGELIGRTLSLIQRALDESCGRALTWELVVCDNASTDSTAEIAERSGARVVSEPERQISRARNAGAAVAEGDWLLFVDADTYPLPGLITELLEVMRSGDCVGCGTTVQAEGGSLWNRLRIERLNPFFRLFNWCGGAFILCTAEAFRSIGGFSTDLYALEEIDFVLRLKRHGRAQGKRFKILHRHPVITSARKDELSLASAVTLVSSTLLSVVLLVLYFVLPRRLRVKGSTKLLGYWYGARR